MAKAALTSLKARHDPVDPDETDLIVALDGDGFLHYTMQRFLDIGTPVFGMNRGSARFLMNAYDDVSLMDKIIVASEEVIHPLWMRAEDESGEATEALAINEVALFRGSAPALPLRIMING